MIFYSDSGSFNDLDVSGSLRVSGSGRDVFSVSGSNGSYINVYDLTTEPNIFQITSGSIDVFKIDKAKNVIVSGSIIVTGSTNFFNIADSVTNRNVSQLVFSNDNNSNGVFGLNNNTVTMNYGAGETFSYYNNKDEYVQVAGTWGTGSLFMQPYNADNFQFDRLAIPIFMSNAANTNSSVALTLSMRWGLYTRNASTLSLLTNYSTVMTFQSTLSTGNSSLYHGVRLWTTGITNTITEGQYYVGMLSNQSTANVAGTINNIVVSQLNSTYAGLFGQAPNLTNQYTLGLGFYSTTTANLPASIAFSQIYGAGTGTVAASNSTLSLALRPPIFYLVSQTF